VHYHHLIKNWQESLDAAQSLELLSAALVYTLKANWIQPFTRPFHSMTPNLVLLKVISKIYRVNA